jgi:PucR family transcriptional regulator, purine catabolism regulatory protein
VAANASTPADHHRRFPTVRDVLALDAIARGAPEVVAGAAGLDRPVRWTHVSEVVDIAHLLRGGELLLTTGLLLPDDPPGLRAFITELSEVGAAALVVELGRRYARTLPPALVEAAEKAEFPLVVLHHEIRFISVGEQVHALIVDSRTDELAASERLHSAFTELTVEGAAPEQIVTLAARLASRPVVLENLAHQVLAYEALDLDPSVIIDRWESRSRAVVTKSRLEADERSGWLITKVGARGNDWGRLILVDGEAENPHDRMLLERAAGALALNRLVERDQDSLERQTHRALIDSVITHSTPLDEIALRSRALGVLLEDRTLVATVVRRRAAPPDAALEAQAQLRDLTERCAQAVRESSLTALVGPIDDSSVALVVSMPIRADVEAQISRVAKSRALNEVDPIIAVGTAVSDLQELRAALLEARHIAEAAGDDDSGRLLYRLPDVRLRGLMHLLRDDSRLHAYVERELGALLTYDDRHRTDLVDILRTYLDTGRNKSIAATTAHLSRPAFYERLHRIERVLGVDLDDVDTCLSLHVALVALDAVRREHRARS